MSQLTRKRFGTFSIIGPIQADRADGTTVPQDYRQIISGLVHRIYPGIAQYQPEVGVQEAFESLEQPDIKDRFQPLISDPKQRRLLAGEFLSATRAVGECDLVICWLPGSQVSMGTAMELYSAHLGGSYIILVSPNRNNLAVQSVIVDQVVDLVELEELLLKLRPLH